MSEIAFPVFHWADKEPVNATLCEDESLAELLSTYGNPDSIELRVVQQYPEPLEIKQSIFYTDHAAALAAVERERDEAKKEAEDSSRDYQAVAKYLNDNP